MKLAVALKQRAGLQTRVDDLIKRAQASVRHQEGEKPPEVAQDLYAEAMRISETIADLQAKINLTNSVTAFGTGQVLTNALAHRDALRLQLRIIKAVADAATKDEYGRYSYGRRTASELVDVIAVKMDDIRTREDQIRAELEELDNKIQETGWATDLRE